MTTRIGINGFGRIGRNLLRAAFEESPPLEIVAVNDVADREILAHLLKYDSTYGRFPAAVEAGEDSILVDGAEIKVFSEADPGALPWGELDVELVIEATGRFRTRAEAVAHLDAGARRVIVSAPVKDPDVTVALGVNFDEAYDAERQRSSPTPPARPTAWRPLRRSSTKQWGSSGG